MTKPPRRWKDETEGELSVDETIAAVGARLRREDPPKFERAEYLKFKADALAAAGLHDEAREAEPEAEVAPEDMTVEQHLQRMQRPQR